MKQYAALDDTIYLWFASNDTSGSGGDGASAAADVRLAGAAADAAPVYSPTPTLLSHINYPAGAYEIAITASAANGFATGNTYAVFCTLAIDSQNPTGFVGSFDLKPVESNLIQIGDGVQSATDLKDFADEGYDPATNKVQGVVLTDTCTTTTNLTNAATNGDLTATMKTSVNTEADTALTDYDPPTKTEMDSAFTEIKGATWAAGTDTLEHIRDKETDIETDTAEIGAAGAGLTDLGGMSTGMKAEIESEANDALVAQKLDHLVAVADADDVVDNSIIAKLASKGATADWSTFVNTTDSLEAIRDRGDASWVTANIASLALEATLTVIKGATFAGATDSLEAIRDRGDAAWTTGAGGSDRLLMVDTTIATLASQTGFTLAAGSADDNAYNNCTIVIEDASTATQKAVGIISDYTGGSKTVTLKYDPAIFTMAPSDKVYILAENALKATLANRQLNVAADGDIAGNIDGSVASVVGYTAQTGDSYAIVNNASYGNAKLVRSTAPANALDVSATGEAGLDFANIKNATGAHTLTNITVPTVSTLTGHTAQTGDNFARLGAPAGASVSADILTIDNFVDEIESRLTAARAGYLDNLSAGAVALASGVDLTSIHGSALTETVNGYLAAGFVKLFDVATPLLVASSAMRGTNSAALAATALSDAVWTNAKAAFLDHSIATVDGNVDTLVTRIPDTISLANINGEVDTALSDIKLDHLVNIAVDTDWATTVHLDSVIGQLADVGTAATFDRTTDALEALRSRGDAAWVTATGFNTTTPPTVTQIRQEMDTNSTKMAPSQVLADYKATGFSTHSAADVKTAIEAAGSSIAQILADTDELQGDWADGGRLDLLIDAILLDTRTTLDALVKRILGLEQENVFIDNTTYAGVHMTGARVRIYSVAGSVGTVNDVIATYTMTASYTGDEMDDYKVVKS